MLERQRRADHLERAPGRDRARGAAAGWPVGVHAIGDRANREALDAFERTRDVWQPPGCGSGSSTRSACAPEDCPRFAELGVAVSAQFSHAPSDEQLAKRYWADRLDGRTRSARCSTSARCSRTAPTRRSRSSSRGPASSRRSPATGGADQRLRSSRRCTRPASRRPGSPTTNACAGRSSPAGYADLVVLDRDPFALEPEELPRGAGRGDDGRGGAGCTTRRPGIEPYCIRPTTKFDQIAPSTDEGRPRWKACITSGMLRPPAGALDRPAAGPLPVDHAHGPARPRRVLDLHLRAGRAAGAAARRRPRAHRLHLRRDGDRPAREAASRRRAACTPTPRTRSARGRGFLVAVALHPLPAARRAVPLPGVRLGDARRLQARSAGTSRPVVDLGC